MQKVGAPAITPAVAIRDALPQSSYGYYSSAPGISQVPDFRNAGDCVQVCLADSYWGVGNDLGCGTKECLCEDYRRPRADRFLTSCVHDWGCRNGQDVASAVLLFDEYCGFAPTPAGGSPTGGILTVGTTPTVSLTSSTSSAASSSPRSTGEFVTLTITAALVCLGIISTISL